ncbi:serine aminopeptidase domain-containing protein [Streptomyces sp. NPDC058221]|uniref:serine aminopeptidase domain-containing protein n=1 Tax=Streptomyces sp. NPDC058221 TaxID=3346388 RepID=UPI0036E0E5B3
MPEYSDHFGPEGLRTRGTVLVVPGRGETRAAYARFGRRLAADAYRVRVIDAPEIDADDLTGSLTGFGAQLATALEGTAAQDGVVHPVVVVGADTGAAAVAALLGREDTPAARLPEAVVLAGLPGHTATTAGTWDQELDVRTFCPAHRGALTEDSGVRRGSLQDAVPDALLAAAYGSDLGVPALVLVGDADALADRAALARTAKSLSRARLSVVRDAHHDVLNDLQHRSVAAEIVTFLETLRNELVPLIAVESSAW